MTSIWHKRATEEKSVHQLLDCLYDAAIHDDRWIDFCRETTQWLGGISMNLNCQTARGFEYVATHRMPPEFSTIYPLHFLEIDPWGQGWPQDPAAHAVRLQLAVMLACRAGAQ
jgi:hypothetical protein